MRVLKIESTTIVDGHRLYYNFIKTHQAFEGKTPSGLAGFSIDSDNKWLTTMRNAVKYSKNYNHNIFV